MFKCGDRIVVTEAKNLPFYLQNLGSKKGVVLCIPHPFFTPSSMDLFQVDIDGESTKWWLYATQIEADLTIVGNGIVGGSQRILATIMPTGTFRLGSNLNFDPGFTITKKVCECGAEKCGSSKHSSWCPKGVSNV